MRVQDFKTQEVIEELQLKEEDIPGYRLEEIRFIAENFKELKKEFPMFGNTKSLAEYEEHEDTV